MVFNNGFLITYSTGLTSSNKNTTYTLPIAHSSTCYVALKHDGDTPNTAAITHRSIGIQILNSSKLLVYLGSSIEWGILTAGY